MSSPATNPYDETLYPNHAYAQTHPDRLATIATLLGMSPAPPGRCRLLEIGCGDGTNVLAMAVDAPGSEFVGLDLASRPIAAARAAAAELRLSNVTFLECSVADAPRDLGLFDYVTAHGVYSWVPREVRDALLALCRTSLAPQGVAYVSYSVYPGAYIRRMLREMMLFHVRGFPDVPTRVQQAAALVQFLSECQGDPDPVRQVMRAELARYASGDAAVLRHDDLADVNDPVWFHEFVAHARAHDLAFLSEADWYSSSDADLAPATREALRRLGPDRILREQYLDFLRCRRFRQTLLVHETAETSPQPRLDAVHGFRVACRAHVEAQRPGLGTRAVERFEGLNGNSIQTDAPIVRAALGFLNDVWPQRLAFDDLAARAEAAVAEATHGGEAPGAKDVEFLAGMLTALFGSGFLSFHLREAACAARAGERPVASALARHQARTRKTVTSLLLASVVLEDETARRLLVLLDGTNDRASLLAHLKELAAHREIEPVDPLDEANLERALDRMAHLGLLTA